MDDNNINNPENQGEMPEELSGEKIIKVNLENQMKSAYIDYSMSVIISRALPDVRDGLKPVHRRVLYGMKELGVTSRSGYKKCSVSITRTATLLSTTPWCEWPRAGHCVILWWTVKVTSARSTATALLPCVTPRRAFRRLQKRCSTTSTRTPSTSRTTSTTHCKSLPYCLRRFLPCW